MNLQIHTSSDYYCKFLSEPLVLIHICIYVKKKFLSFVFWLITNTGMFLAFSCVGLEKGWFPGNAGFPCALGPYETICHLIYEPKTFFDTWTTKKTDLKKCYLSNVSMKSNYNIVKKSCHIGLQLY